ncbi:glycerol-3-phosphate acyltransferase [Salinivibrio sp. MA351]|jgi:glycerol-3-phosphate acyltransferase PlsY|uniref:Glycerol-3-phosphate acyltransferase n=1 Tax=Salinivibrio costicola subsp. alcaliphilus TaxID=272773 RepID=A0ABX3KR65_SALCS|nr:MULTISPECIES: glycerol-3-phosphate 1-O-acyltransferase PlsY [Salinivibrio]OOE94372.1 glycerol-3-phosphate acyltransferase [Salinivibrio sp. AR647]OOF00311.1 glycerol-3-phosphate acyltransferase [Salinivibrio sp. IB643]OOF01477.1 glycerol-3-phosphate acyltransferase [Salinivibrio sp. MA351]OOF20017.1 glycerol-3-phosphate acyltransferase [Salinivibrio sp. MA427]OOF34132.1 glycerol-3-phosphate acyltransferase [Salinivibrio costicola subsp. alcaliphilus]
MTALAIAIIIAAYLLGSVSSAVLVCRAFGLPDPRDQGSKNPGATNVYRLGGRFAAALVLLCDMLKGTIPVWLSYLIGINPFLLGLIAIAACLGHIYPVFFHFRGGKGVATALGAMAPIGLSLTGLLVATWGLVLVLTGYSSLSAIVTAIVAPLFTWWIKPQFTMPVAMLSCLILFRHYDNIRRLLDGEEKPVLLRWWRRER